MSRKEPGAVLEDDAIDNLGQRELTERVAGALQVSIGDRLCLCHCTNR